jgi:hypothetical protein
MSEAFFHRPSTHALIDELADLSSLTVYVGAGASMDRTGLSWAHLADSLLTPFYSDFGQRRDIIDGLGTEGAISAAAELFRQSSPSDTRRIEDHIRGLLYRRGRVLAGRLTENIVALAILWWEFGRSICIATPNYDDWLLDAFELAGWKPGEAPLRHIVAGRDNRKELQHALAQNNEIVVVHLHGHLTDAPDSSQQAPVLTEADYHVTARRSARFLRVALRDRHLLAVGSGLTDPPLLRALHEERDDRYARLAVMPRQSLKKGRAAHVQQAYASRCRHLGLRLVMPDFHIQVGQLLQEMALQLDLSDIGQPPYQAPVSAARYGSRLSDWWWHWSRENGLSRKSQVKASKALEKALDEQIRPELQAMHEEPLKLELWVRWHPESARELALWGSSMGPLWERRALKREPIDDQSPNPAIRAFTTGSPTFSAGEPGSRWVSVLSAPIHVADPSVDASVPVGVISLLSMRQGEETSVGEGNLTKLADALVQMRELALQLLTPAEYTYSD